jgi:TPR repeat protein
LAKERDPRAQFFLGLYVYGNPDSKLFDLTKAAPLLLDASERGYTPAMIPLAGAYAEGKGVPKSFYESYKWLSIAEYWNTPNVATLLEQVGKELKPEEIEKAKKEAMAFTFKTK